MEPKTAVSPLTVVLVDGDGEAKRFPLNEDALLRELARTRGLPVFEATRVGYPERMRRRHAADAAPDRMTRSSPSPTAPTSSPGTGSAAEPRGKRR